MDWGIRGIGRRILQAMYLLPSSTVASNASTAKAITVSPYRKVQVANSIQVPRAFHTIVDYTNEHGTYNLIDDKGIKHFIYGLDSNVTLRWIPEGDKVHEVVSVFGIKESEGLILLKSKSGSKFFELKIADLTEAQKRILSPEGEIIEASRAAEWKAVDLLDSPQREIPSLVDFRDLFNLLDKVFLAHESFPILDKDNAALDSVFKPFDAEDLSGNQKFVFDLTKLNPKQRERIPLLMRIINHKQKGALHEYGNVAIKYAAEIKAAAELENKVEKKIREGELQDKILNEQMVLLSKVAANKRDLFIVVTNPGDNRTNLYTVWLDTNYGHRFLATSGSAFHDKEFELQNCTRRSHVVDIHDDRERFNLKGFDESELIEFVQSNLQEGNKVLIANQAAAINIFDSDDSLLKNEKSIIPKPTGVVEYIDLFGAF